MTAGEMFSIPRVRQEVNELALIIRNMEPRRPKVADGFDFFEDNSGDAANLAAVGSAKVIWLKFQLQGFTPADPTEVVS